jgi:hypothetical protein
MSNLLKSPILYKQGEPISKPKSINKKSKILKNETKILSSIKKNQINKNAISKKKKNYESNNIFLKNKKRDDILIILYKLKMINVNIVFNLSLLPNLIILKNSLDEINNTTELCNVLNNYTINTTEKWTECENECLIISKSKIIYEINSTIFYLKILSNMLISSKSLYYIYFKIHNNLTGLWKDDHKNIEMLILNKFGKRDNRTNLRSKTRLIMGFGPSASGKSFNTFTIIELMKIIDKMFPSYFLSIDGGIFRERSHIYQTILNCKYNTINGYSNLVKPDPKQGLFDASYVKENIVLYLNYLKSERKFKISLYIPETLPSCDDKTCYSKYEKYIQLTDDKNWIGLLIYQHKTAEECEFNTVEQYSCIGTTISGERRQLIEGKRYSSVEWEKSYENGYREMMKAPIYRFKLHNTGKIDGINMFYDYSVMPLNAHTNFYLQIEPFIIKKNWVYNQEDIILSDKSFVG